MKQILALLILVSMISCFPKKDIIAIQPYGSIPGFVIDSISLILEEAYAMDIILLENTELPESAFINLKSPRYRADSLLLHLKRIKPDSIGYIIGVTESDISSTKRNADGSIKEPISRYRDWGIFGLGFRPGPSCVISTFRLKHQDPKTYYDRIQKVAIHEIGHNLGLKHCDNPNCVMQDAVESIKTVDMANKVLCSKCLNDL